jgi:hypothetical protein
MTLLRLISSRFSLSSIDATDSTCIGRFINHGRRNANIKALLRKESPGIFFRAIKVMIEARKLKNKLMFLLFECRIFQRGQNFFMIMESGIRKHSPCTHGYENENRPGKELIILRQRKKILIFKLL